MTATTRLRDGSVLTASFVPTTAPAPNRNGIMMAHSTDLAKSWTTWTAPLIENLWRLSWYRVHRDLIELADGTILLGAYGHGTINGVTKQYSLVFESTDGGRTFRQRAAINAGSPESTNELGMSRTSDGRLIAVMRGAETQPRPPAMPLSMSFSNDRGVGRRLGVGPPSGRDRPAHRLRHAVHRHQAMKETTVLVNGKVAGTTTAALAKVREFHGFRAETGLISEDVGNMEHGYDDVAITPLR